MAYRENAAPPKRPYSAPRLKRFYLLGLFDRVRYRAWSWVHRILPASLPSSRTCLTWCGCGDPKCERDLEVNHAVLADTHVDGFIEPHAHARDLARELDSPKGKQLADALAQMSVATPIGARVARPVRVPDERTARYKV